MKYQSLAIAAAVAACVATSAQADGHVYGGFPVTLKGYSGDKDTSVSYSGQIARHVLHNSLKSLVKQGDRAKMMAYFDGKDAGRAIVSPKSKEGFGIKQGTVDEISKGVNLAGKTYKGGVPGWPGSMTGPEVLSFMIDKAAAVEGGYDNVNGLDYVQLISKTAMGAVFYHQAVDNYLDEKLAADNKPNDKPYKAGAYYTGKEHSWDEAFGYFGTPAHTLSLDPKTVSLIAKGKPEVFKAADANGDGKIDLKTEMTYAHAYYAAAADKSGKSNYLKTITKAFIDGRKLIADAKGEKLTDGQRRQLMAYADTIKTNWEKVIAEAVYKYAGSVYEDLKIIDTVIETKGEIMKPARAYHKHWGELKGFALALQMGGKDLGETAVKLNRLIGFSPMLLGGTQVTGINAKGNYVQEGGGEMTEYMLHMIQVQNLLDEKYGLAAKTNMITDDVAALSEKLKSMKETAEND